MYGVIYKITNMINGKLYIGQSKDYKRRKISHKKDFKKSDTILYRAMRKYGFDNFSWEVIDTANTPDELNNKEMYWIDYYNSYIGNKNNNGYNMTKGGYNEAYFFLLTSVVQLDLHGNFIAEYKSISEAANTLNIRSAGISGCCLGYYKSSNGFMFVYKNKYDKSKKYKYVNQGVTPIIQLTLEGEFISEHKSIRDAIAYINAKSSSNIIACCQGINKSSYGYIWVYKTNYDEGKKYEYKLDNPKNLKPVIQFTMDGDFVAKYKSINEASFKTGITSQLISLVCHKRRNQTGGFKWEFEDAKYV